MITSFKVGAIFEIQDRATTTVVRLAEEMAKLAASAERVREEFASLSSIRIGSITTRINAMVAAMDKGMTAATNMATATASGAAAMDAGLSTAVATARALTAQLVAAGRAGAGLRVPRGFGAGGGSGGGGGGGPPPLPPPIPGGGRGGGRHGLHFGRVGAHVGPMHVSTGTSGDGIAAGLGLWSVAHVMKEAQEPLHQEAMLGLLGLDPEQVAQVISQARATATAVPGSGFTGNVKAIGEMYSVVGLPGALGLSEKMAQVDRAMALSGKGSEEGSSYILTRAGELMGKLTDPVTHQVDLAKFGQVLDVMSRVVVATHGKVTPSEWLNFAKQAGPASGALTGEGMYTEAAVIQAMGGHRAGTAAAALQRQFAGGKMSGSVAKELTDLGIALPGDLTVERGGHVFAKTGAMKELVEKMQRDPLSGIIDVIAPALMSHGYDTPEKQAAEIYKMIGTGPAQREVYEVLRGREQIRQERDRAQAGLAPGAALPFAGEHDPTQAMTAFTKAFNDLLGAVGSPTMMASIPLMNGLTSMFNALAAAAGGHRAVTGVIGSMGAGAAAGAGLGFVGGWLGGPVGAGSGALIGAGAGAGMGLWNALPTGVTEGAKSGFMRGSMFGGPALGGVVGGITGGLWGALPAALPFSTPAAAASAPNTTKVDANITVKAETDDPQGLAQRILAEINKLISQGHLHNQGEGDSVASSPYATGMGVP